MAILCVGFVVIVFLALSLRLLQKADGSRIAFEPFICKSIYDIQRITHRFIIPFFTLNKKRACLRKTRANVIHSILRSIARKHFI
jgi:hypothetical protein